MTHLDPVPGHTGLFALPTEPDRLLYVAQVTLGFAGGNYTSAKVPSTPNERENLWRNLNEAVAMAAIEPDDGDALAHLNASLGADITATDPEHPANFESRRIAARHIARAKCRVALEAGYQP